MFRLGQIVQGADRSAVCPAPRRFDTPGNDLVKDARLESGIDGSGRSCLTPSRRNLMYDAIVIGARCAGSPTAMLLARRGYRVLLLDRAGFPSDTFRNHFIQQLGIVQLHRWGLLNTVS